MNKNLTDHLNSIIKKSDRKHSLYSDEFRSPIILSRPTQIFDKLGTFIN